MALSPSELAGQIVALRAVRSAVERSAERQRLAQVLSQLRRQLGVGVPKRQAAAVLGVSVQGLDRWIAARKIPVVRRPGSSRELVEADALLVLAEKVAQLREQGETRALANKSLPSRSTAGCRAVSAGGPVGAGVALRVPALHACRPVAPGSRVEPRGRSGRSESSCQEEGKGTAMIAGGASEPAEGCAARATGRMGLRRASTTCCACSASTRSRS